MIRLIIQKIPFGKEEEKFEITRFNISNIGDVDGSYAEYKVHKIDTDEVQCVWHYRRHGVLELIRKAMRNFVYPPKRNER